MISNLLTFVLVLAILFDLKHIFGFIMNIRQPNPEQITLNIYETVLSYASTAYIITSIITIF